MTRGDRFVGRTNDPYSSSRGSSFGATDDFVAPSDDSDASLISLFKRLLTTKFVVFGDKKDVAATSDDTEASLISLIKRLLGKIRVTDNRIDVNADVEIPAIGETNDPPAATDTATASLISITKRINTKIPLTNSRVDVNAVVDALGNIFDAPAATDTDTATAIAFLKRISGKIPTVGVLGETDEPASATDTGDATVIALLKRVLVRMGELLGGEEMEKIPISGTAQLTTLAESVVIPVQDAPIHLNKIIIANESETSTLVEIKSPTKSLLTLLSPANSNQSFDFSGSAITTDEQISASNLTSTTTYLNLLGYSSSGGSGGTSQQLDWVSDGDANGVFHYIGTDKNTVAWSNPNDGGKISLSASSNATNISVLVNRAESSNSEFYTNSAPGEWVQVDLIDYQLVCNRYTIQNTDAYITLNWEFQGSNDAASWTTLDTVTDNPATPYAWVNRTISNTDSWRYFRVLMNGLDSSGSSYLTFSEIELYGSLFF